jgi:hypothetical protein
VPLARVGDAGSNARMLVASRAFLTAGALAAVAAAQQQLDYPALLQRLVDVDWLWSPPLPGEKCVQWSSWDRASKAGPGNPDAWYANNDRGQHLRVEERNGAKEYVMVDATGPGCVARIWSANPSGTLHFDVDGARVWSVDFLALCSGKVDGVPEPLAGMRARGGNCYLPIPFQKSLVVSCTSGDTYYAFDVVQWAEETRVPTFSPALLREVGARNLPHLGRSVFVPGISTPTRISRRSVDANSIVRGVELVALRRSNTQLDAEGIQLVVTVGEEVTVRVPLLDFFCTNAQLPGHRGQLLGWWQQEAYCRFPMPFPQAGTIELQCDDDRAVDARETVFTLLVHAEPRALRPDALLFRAGYHLAKGTPTRPFSDHVVLDAKGTGRFVGCSLLVRNPSRIWWGEGDEKFTVDGEAFPSWFGTGTEDYFGYAWCDPTPFSAPFHAQVECQGPGNFGFTQLHRTHVLDSVPFQQSFRFDLERWHWRPDIAVDYATVAYWYGAPGATSGLPPVPPAKDRELPRLEPPPMLVAKDALEGEALRVVSCSGGVHEAQDVSFLESTFSRDAARWWRDGAVGDALVLAVPVPAAGRYKVTAAFVQADDYGIVQCSLGGAKLGAPFDGYAPQVRSSGPVELGTIELAAGERELRVAITGRNEHAKPRFMFGLDWLRLERLP